MDIETKVKIINDFVESHDIQLLEWKSVRSKRNKWLINDKIVYRGKLSKILEDFAVDNGYCRRIDLHHTEMKDLFYQFSHKTKMKKHEMHTTIL